MQRKQALLSRLDQDAYVKLPAYAADYWNEHRENFAKMLKELMLEETLKSVLGEASKTSLKWNHVKKTVDPKYNEDVILEAYKRLCDIATKDFILKCMTEYFGVVSYIVEMKASPDTPLSLLFGSDIARQRMQFLAEKILESNYDAHMYATVFVPQLHIFFLRMLDIYDRSLQGRIVEDYLASRHIDASDVKRKEESLQDEESVKQFWGRATAALTTEARAAASARAVEAMTKDLAELGKEVLVLQAGTQKACHDLNAAAREKGTAFAEKWRAMTQAERKTVLVTARAALAAPDQPRLGVFYCPELHTADLSANSESFLQLLSRAKEQGMPELQTLTGVITRHVESEQRGGSLPVIVLTRQYVIAQFCLRTMAAVLGAPAGTK